MSQGFRVAPWLRQVAVVVGYVVAYQLVRSVSISHWQLQVGLNLSCVLMLSRRRWPALLVGGLLATLPIAYRCLPLVGPVAAALMLFPVIVFAMLPVWLLRKQLPTLASGSRVLQPITTPVVLRILACVVITGLLTATYDTALLLTQIPPDSPRIWAIRYLLGAYLGCLTMVPVVLAAYEAIRRADSWIMVARHAARSRLLLEGIVLGVGCLGLLTLLSYTATEEQWRQVARMAMFVPVAWMAVRYSWQGAAVGGTAASVGLVLAMPTHYDANTMLAQTFMAGAVTLLLPLGAYVGRLNEQERQANESLRHGLQAARRALYQAELSLHAGVQATEHLYDGLAGIYSQLLQKAKRSLYAEEERSYRDHLTMARIERFWLTNSVHPVQWERSGFPTALVAGPIAHALKERTIAYDARVPETVNALTSGAQMMLYRLACEAVAHLLEQASTAHRIQLRVIVSKVSSKDALWVALVVESEPASRIASTTIQSMSSERPQNHFKLSVMAPNLENMRDRAGLYEGKVRTHKNLYRITASLLDTPETASA